MLLRRTHASDGFDMSTQRIEAFSDGVFAIAITLLILELRVPEDSAGHHFDLAASLRSLWPSYFAYILSFVIVGIYWANHHFVFKLYKRTNHVFNLLNVFFLMCVSFLPFPTSVLAKHMQNAADERTAVAFYTFGLLLPALSWMLMWLYASKGYRLIDKRLTPSFVNYMTGQYILSTGLYLLALIASLINPKYGLGVAVGLTLLYLAPPKRPVYREIKEEESEG
ncbi:DUF1211 domain-containing membrane protein [Capsulimonas corticalis]|uniref:DUF1211 domain-containing membrane protein n=1 Tax=Capsulimonas corticalis TaxID=2219043 RepID=A0A402D4G9_9BACT|nr:TMEM175 family protein [Capsulimonas corticalis]BDI29177.1 DUF1211 domain-containing membrane protein [Capsulimonas corticalis]